MPEPDQSRRPGERDLPPPAERISLRQAAELMGKTTKAVQQLISRGSLGFAREDVNPATDRAARVVTTEAWVREYMGGSPAPAAPVAREPEADNVRPIQPQQKSSSSESYWQALAERQAIEILRLQAELAELKRR